MDKNNLTGFLLMGALLVGFFIFSDKKAKEQQQEKQEQKEEVVKPSDKGYLGDTTMIQSSLTTDSIAIDSLSQEVVANEEFFVLENEQLKLTFSNKGGRLVQAEMNQYENYESYIGEKPHEPITLFTEDHSQFSWNIDGKQSKDILFQVEQTEQSITFTKGDYVQEYMLNPENPFVIDYAVDFGVSEAELDWSINFVLQEKDIRSEREFTFAAYKPVDGKFKKFNKRQKGISTKVVPDPLHFISFRQRFFNQTIAGNGIFSNTTITSTLNQEDTENIKQLDAKTSVDFTQGKATMQLLISPNDRDILKSFDKHLVNIQPKGVLGLTKALAALFNMIKGAFNNYGLLILLMTIVIKLILTPLTYRSYLSQAKMGVLKPEIEQLKVKYKNDQAKISQEQMKLYSKAGVNPLGGCIPSVIQIPIFFSLYYFFRSSIYFRQKDFLWAEDLSTYDSIIKLPFTVPIFNWDHISIFAILYGVALFFSMRLTTSMSQGVMGASQTPEKKDDMANMMHTQMKFMQYAMPVFLPFIFNAFPVALTFYYFCYNMINALQTLIIKKFVIDEDKILAQIEENKKKPKKKGGFRQKLEEAMKAQQELQQKDKK